MATKIAYLEAVVGADITQFRRGMAEIRNETGLFAERATNQFGAVGRALNDVGRTLTYTMTVPLVTFGTASAQAAMAFERNMNNVNSIAKMSQTQLKNLSVDFQEIASNSIFGAEAVSSAGYEIFSAGVTDSALATAVLSTSVKVAEANLADLDATTRAINATIAAFDLTAKDATFVGNVWTRMVQLGVGSMDDFLSNAQKILPLAKEVGLSFEELGATVAFASQGGGGAAKAETAVAQTISNLLRPNETMLKGFRELGVKNAKELLSAFGGLAPALMALKRVGKDAFPKMFAKSGLEAVLRLTANIDKTTASFREFNKELGDATQSAWEEQSKSTEFQLRRLGAAFEGVQVIVGQQLLPAIAPFIEGLQDIMQTILDLNPEVIQLGVLFGAALAGLPPLIWAVGSALSLLVSPIGIVVGAIAGLGAAFTLNLGGVRDFISGIIGGFDGIQKAIDIFMANFNPRALRGQHKQAGELIGSDYVEGIQVAITKDTSASWIYETYFKDTYASFQDFNKELVKQGYQGGAIHPTDTFPLLMGLTKSSYNDYNMQDFLDPKQRISATAVPFFERLAAGLRAAWPALESAFNDIVDNLKTWFTDTFLPSFDTWGGDILNSIADSINISSSDFSGGGTLYQTIKNLFSGDLTQAGNDFEKWIQETFPSLSSGINVLFETIVGWIASEAIPTASRLAGFFSGMLLGGIINGIDLAATLISGILSGSTSVNQIGDYLMQAVGKPMAAGFSEGFMASAANNTVNKWAKALDEATKNPETKGIVAIAIRAMFIGVDLNSPEVRDSLVNSLKTLFAAVGGILAATVFVPFASAVIAPFIAAIGGGLVAAIGDFALSAAVVAAPLLVAAAPFALIAAGVVTLYGLLTSPDVQNSLSGWNEAFKYFGILVTQTITNAYYDVVNFFNKIMLKADEAALYISGALVALGIVPEANVTITAAKTMGVDLATQVYDALRSSGDLTGFTQIPYLLSSTDVNSKILVDSMLNALPNKALIESQLTDAITNSEYANLEILFPLHLAAMTYKMSPEEANKAVQDWLSGLITSGALTEQSAKRAAEAIQASGGSAGNMMIQSFLNGFIPTGGNFTGFGGNWSTAGTTGTNMWATLGATPDLSVLTDAADDTIKMATNIQDFSTNITDKAIPNSEILKQTQNEVADKVKKSADEAKRLADQLLIASGAIAKIPDITITISTDGTHAAGLTRVPFDGYIAELHKGERVLTAAEARQFDARATLGYNTQGNTTVQNTTNNVAINGVQDVDRLLMELKRRGIYVS